jgi:peptidoglycan/xylan/chitin deacetylase (PgdA/CDA1 family)
MYYCGLINLLARYGPAKNGFVLMYHRVLRNSCLDEDITEPGMYVADKTFEDHLKSLRKYFTVITLEELISRIHSREKIRNCCAITFDDGWKDNYEIAFPLIKKYEIPITIFLASGFIGTERWFWPEELILHLKKINKYRYSIKDELKLIHQLLPAFDKAKNYELWIQEVIKEMKKFTPEKRENILNSLRQLDPTVIRKRMLLNWDEIIEMYNSKLVSFGSHTINHVILDQLDNKTKNDEIKGSKDQIANKIGSDIKMFAYPNGNYNKEETEILINNGFMGAVTTKRDYLNKDTPIFEIPRIGMHEDVSNYKALFLARIVFKGF